MPNKPGVIRKFTRMALAETLFTKCFICKGVGTVFINNSSIENVIIATEQVILFMKIYIEQTL